MEIAPLPQASLEILLADCIQRDTAIGRRAALLKILLHERYLKREQLMERVEGLLGRGCFGAAAWEDTFYRDMCVVKAALRAAGYSLAYKRSPRQPGYYLSGQPAVSAKLSEILNQSVAEVDPAQIHIWRRLTPAERFRLACSVTDAARDAAVYRVRQRQPGLSLVQASFLALQGRLVA